jgi:hypothetical protein
VRAARRRLQRQAPAIDVAAADALAVSTATLPGAPPSWRLGRAASAARRAIAATVSAMTAPLVSLAAMPWDDDFVRSLPGDHSGNPASRQLHGVAYALAAPTAVAAPRLLAWADEVGALLGVARPVDDADPTVAMLAGNLVAPGARPYAACYGGHQFGHWAGQLGDGRAITLGELIGPDGAALGGPAEGRRPDAVLAPRRRPRRAALVGARVPVQRGDASPRGADDARAEPRRHRRRGRARHVLRRQSASASRARSCVGWRRRSSGSAISSCRPRAAITAAARTARRLHDPARFSRTRRGCRGRQTCTAGPLVRTVCERTARMVAHWMRVGSSTA